jgi:hypothetical protein
MQTLSYGFKKPQAGDQGSALFTAIEDNFQQLNDHTHNGSNSPQLTSSALSVTTQSIVSGSWVSQGNGTYKQTVAMPGSLQFDTVDISFRHSTLGHPLMLTVEKVSATSYDVYINDNTISLTANYGI